MAAGPGAGGSRVDAEASGFLVGPPVFKTGERCAAALAGSIPVRLRNALPFERALTFTLPAMTTPQRTAGSGFGSRSTTNDVLHGIDLAGQLAIVTARRPAAAREAIGGIDGVEIDELDLADLDSVRGLAKRFLASGRPVDIVINNAGIMACPETRVGPGWEAQFATNHLGHYALINLLWPAIVRNGAARVVAVSTGLSESSRIHWDDP